MDKISKWDQRYAEEITLEKVKELYSSGHYRVSHVKYPASTQLPGCMRAGECYVISGSCVYLFGALKIALSSGEYTKLPKGSYILEVSPNENLEIVLVWDLSDLK